MALLDVSRTVRAVRPVTGRTAGTHQRLAWILAGRVAERARLAKPAKPATPATSDAATVPVTPAASGEADVPARTGDSGRFVFRREAATTDETTEPATERIGSTQR